MTNKYIKISCRFWIVLLIAIFTTAGCAVKVKDTKKQETISEETRGFGHKIHIEGGVACNSCHMNADKNAEAGMPNEILCGFCHKTVYDNQQVGNYYNMSEWKSAHMVSRAKYQEINMSHAQHISMGVKCEECHADIANSVKVTSAHIPVKATCFKCHAGWNTQEKCETCHKEIRYDQPPLSHKQGDFSKKHGHIYREESISTDKNINAIPSCARCHFDSYCVNCHQEQPPENHTNQWRLIGHGITAGIDRNSCAVCHNTDFCIRCHDSTKPRSHQASSWGNPSNGHCQSCHLPINSTNCNVCHKEAPSHSKEAPGSHTAGWGNPVNKHCANCHVETSTCSVCHNGTPSHKEVPPASHTGQWGSPQHKHCLNCHIPVAVSVRCKECHEKVTAHLEDAPSRPDDLPHRRPLMCRACHNVGSNLIHEDNGVDCRICHKL